jgi:pimeloyl-ACP methyl ester carboxylesterase
MIEYKDQGSGPPLVLVHGYCEAHTLWDDFAVALAPHYRVLRPDLPGFGRSPRQAQPPSLDSLAQALHQWLGLLGVARPVWVGHSLGGYVGLAYAQAHPRQLAGLGLFHSSALPDTAERKAARNQVIAQVRASGVEPLLNTLIPNLFAPGNRQACQGAIAQLIAQGRQLDPEAVAETAAAMRDRPDRTAVLASLACPALFILGKQDAAVPLQASLPQIHLPPDSTVHLLDQVGHMGMFEAPARTLAAVRAFAQGCF